MNKYYVRLFLVVIISLVITPCLFREQYVLAQNETSTQLQAANDAVDQAYANVLKAEKAGGNVTELISRLNVAGSLVASAENSVRIGSASNVDSNAETARQIADQVAQDANALANKSLTESRNSLWVALIFSVIGVIVFLVALTFVWRRFKRQYLKKFLSMKPEVVNSS
jgi:hypothetical protein